MDEEQGLMNSIPPFTEEDYLEGTAPYEYAYQFINDGFTLERVLVVMSNRAWKNAKVRNFRKLFSEYAKKKKALTKMIALDSVTQFDGQELELNCGSWRADEFGVCIETDFGTKYACNHPILPVMRLVNIDTGIEKLVIAYRKGKQWRHVVADKKTLASNTAILELANVGVGVTSENSKLLVQYFHDIETLNYDIIPEKNSVSRLGWIENSGFSPYVEELVFDGDANFKTFFDSVHMGGDYGKWLELAREIRAGQCITTRIILAASFASVLVKILGGLPFFVHLWGGTESGKTVGLMLAASVWANPEIGRFIHTFNSTSVGREKSAAFVNSLPLVLDELQIIKDKKDFDQNIYMLSEGAGRTRGTKTGGVDKTPTWSNCILTSGEMPLTGHLSGGGAVNRIVEIECRERLFDEPRRAADTVKRNYGHAGRIFVECLQQDGGFELAESVFKTNYELLGQNDTTEKQAMAAAMILTADKLATDWVFGDNRELKTDDITEFLQSKAAVSVNARAYDYLCEYVIQNKHRFCGNSDQNEVWGLIDDGMAYIVRSVFNRICADAGFNDRSLLSWLKENDLIEIRSNRFTCTKKINGQPCNCVFLKLPYEEEEDLGLIDDILE